MGTLPCRRCQVAGVRHSGVGSHSRRVANGRRGGGAPKNVGHVEFRAGSRRVMPGLAKIDDVSGLSDRYNRHR